MRNVYTPLKICLLFIIGLGSFPASNAQNPALSYQPVVTGLTSPVDAVFAPGDGRMFIAQQNGSIFIRWRSYGVTLPDFVLDRDVCYYYTIGP